MGLDDKDILIEPFEQHGLNRQTTIRLTHIPTNTITWANSELHNTKARHKLHKIALAELEIKVAEYLRKEQFNKEMNL